MSATTGIHTSGVYGNQAAIPWTPWRERAQEKATRKKQLDQRPLPWLSFALQMVLSFLYALAMLPLMAVGALAALTLGPWLILAPALIAGFVLVLVSYLLAVV